jgi:hypothetical protein
MRRSLIILAAMLLAGAAVFLAGQRLAAHWCAKRMALPTEGLAWLRLEFKLSDIELARARQLHDGYLPQCREFCERIGARKRELQVLLASGTNAPTVIEQKLIEIGTLSARCQAAMLQHFREVSQVMHEHQYETALVDVALKK